MSMKPVVLAGVAGLALCVGFASRASASILTYNLIPSSPSYILVTATVSGGAFNNATVDFNGSATWQLNLTSGSLTLDSGAPALDAFNFLDASTPTETISVVGPHGNTTVGTLSLTNVLVKSTVNPDTPLTGSPYSFNTTNVMDSVTYTATPTGGSTTSNSVGNTGTPINGTIAMGSSPPLSFAQADTIQLGTIPLTIGGTTYEISLKGDTNFEGQTTVPLPPTLWLLAAGLGLLALLWKRPLAGPRGVLHSVAPALAAAGLALAFGAAPGHAGASTLTVTGGGGLNGGELCTSGGFFCPTAGDLTFSGGSNPVSGWFTYSAGEVSFSLTLSSPVTFSSGATSETFETGTTFTGMNIPVSAPTGAGGTVGETSNATTGAATLYYVTSASSTPQTLVDSSLLISALSCQTIGPSQQCGVTLGEAGSSEIPVGPIGTQSYGGVLNFDVSVSPVPLPAAAWLLVSGLGGLVGFGVRPQGRSHLSS